MHHGASVLTLILEIRAGLGVGIGQEEVYITAMDDTHGVKV